MLERIIAFFRGCVVIYAEGRFCERFLNVCMRRGIYLRDVRRPGEDKIVATVSIRAFRELRQIARKTKTHISISKRQGLPFLLHRYRKRKAVFLGLMIFCVMTWYFSTHIMGIDVTGNQRLSTVEIVDALKDFGLYHGASIKGIDRRLVKNRMMNSFEDMAWIGVNIKGSRAYIEVKERLDTRVELDRDVPCDIVAERTGIIRLLEVKNGQTVVKPNQLVEKGDLLVSGVVDSQTKGIRYVHSFGEIYAETSYKKSGEYSLEITEKIYTGETKNRYSIGILGKELKLWHSERQPFEFCDISVETTEHKSPFDRLPSLFVTKKIYKEYTPKKRKRSLEEVLKTAEQELFEQLEGEIPRDGEILDKKVTYSKASEKEVLVTAEILCREDIAQQRIVDKVEVLGYDKEVEE